MNRTTLLRDRRMLNLEELLNQAFPINGRRRRLPTHPPQSRQVTALKGLLGVPSIMSFRNMW